MKIRPRKLRRPLSVDMDGYRAYYVDLKPPTIIGEDDAKRA